MTGPDRLKLQRTALRLVAAENMLDKFMALVEARWEAASAREIGSSITHSETQALRALRAEFATRKSTGRSAAGQRSPKPSDGGSNPSRCAKFVPGLYGLASQITLCRDCGVPKSEHKGESVDG